MNLDSPGSLAEHPRPRVGVSRCLLGDEVRVNGGHCQDRWIQRVLGQRATFVGVCPEVEVGMPTPRPPVRLAITEASHHDEDIRLIESKSGAEWTDRMRAHNNARVEELAAARLHGFILKKDSPTCGVFRVRVYERNGMPTRRGQGTFASALSKRLPNLPVEEEGRLRDPALRESFLIRVHVYANWQAVLEAGIGPRDLVAFHTRHKMLVLAADPGAYRRLGRIVAGHDDPTASFDDRVAAYEAGLMEALKRPVSRGRHINVIQHLVGFCKTDMAPVEKAELARLCQRYAAGTLSRAAPVALVRFLLEKHEAPSWAREQVYLEPYAPELDADQPA